MLEYKMYIVIGVTVVIGWVMTKYKIGSYIWKVCRYGTSPDKSISNSPQNGTMRMPSDESSNIVSSSSDDPLLI